MGKIIYVMGVSGCGKSTIGKLLSDKINLPFFDGDDFHPQDNIDKMSKGIPLNDDDRKEWLVSLNSLALEKSGSDGAIIACSALKESYRQMLQKGIEGQTSWVFLNGSMEMIKTRMKARNAHFMPTSLLDSQFKDLEIPDYGIHIGIELDPNQIIEHIIKELQD